MDKYVLEGWIRAKLEYPQDLGRYLDSHKYYFAEHSKFNPGNPDKDNRIKYVDYSDPETGVTYFVVFGYDEVGIKFTISVSNPETTDRSEVFSSLLIKAISGYKNLKNKFMSDVFPKDKQIGFMKGSEHLLIAPYRFFKDLDVKQQNELVNKTKVILKQYSPHIHIVYKDKTPKDDPSNHKIKIQTMQDLLEEAEFDFTDISVAWGDFYLYVDHYLLRSSFSSFDPSLSVNSVAFGGFLSSLTLQDLHYELTDLGIKLQNLRKKIENIKKEKFQLA